MNQDNTHKQSTGIIWENNPVLIHLLGLSPVLAVSTSLTYGIGLGVATIVICVLSCLTAYLLKKTIPHRWRLLWYMLILASYTTVAETLCQIYFYPLYLKLGIYLPLICCNVAILVRMELGSGEAGWSTATIDAAKTGLGFLIALALIAGLRELLITGSLFANWQLLLPTSSEFSSMSSIEESGRFFRFANTQAGVFILLGLLVALLNTLPALRSSSRSDEAAEVIQVKRARVTGRLSKQ